MTKLLEKLIEAQKVAISIKPKVAGFPVLAEALRQSGVISNRWILPGCQSLYKMKEGTVVQQGEPLVLGSFVFPEFNRDVLIKIIRDDQEGKSTFPEFLNGAWNAGVVEYEVDFIGRKVTYYGVNGECYFEEYPAVKI